MIQIRCDEGFQGLINEKRIRNILKDFLNRLFDSQRGLSVLITNDAEIQKLNKQFRKKDYPTDILSWTYDVGEGEIARPELNESQEENISGELAVSAERVIKQASENGWDFETELIRLLAHGCAHLAGWDHEESGKQEREMLELEIQLLKEAGLKNIY
jgi:probable rRNA maturation factor